jgi:hypothetical protein
MAGENSINETVVAARTSTLQKTLSVGFAVGERAPDFELHSRDGRTVPATVWRALE